MAAKFNVIVEIKEVQRFQHIVLIHLDAAYNYAYYLTRHRHDAEDLVQEACQRAFTAFDRFEQNNAKSWLLTIVRHTFLNHKIKEQKRGEVVYLDAMHADMNTPERLKNDDTPEHLLIQSHDASQLHRIIASLPEDYREVIILRELENLSYADIACILDCALGTVMSRLSRARQQLRKRLKSEARSQGSAQ